jgi:hypothetical protein
MSWPELLSHAHEIIKWRARDIKAPLLYITKFMFGTSKEVK